MKNYKGFTLLELLITMALVILVIMITSVAFNTILKNTSRVTSSEESNIEGVVGLEMFRHDLQQAGFGLPDSYDNPGAIIYYEASVAPANLLNDDSTATMVPRAVVSFDNRSGAAGTDSDDTTISYKLLSGTDYLGIKATTVGRSKASQKWTYVTYSSNGGKTPNVWPNSADNFVNNDRAIVINRSFSKEGVVSNKMIVPAASPNIYWTSNATTVMSSLFNPTNKNEINYIYGIRSYATSTTSDLRMPFNRADYFVARPSKTSKIPSVCAPNSGILYRTNVNHTDGMLTYMPLIDCVADMQVVFGWDDGSGIITESSASGSSVTGGGATPTDVASWMADPAEIKNKLKYVKVYIMAQDGRKDTSFINKNTLGPSNNTYSVVVGEPGATPPSNVSVTKAYTAQNLTDKGWLNYRWKIYRIVVRPKNLTN